MTALYIDRDGLMVRVYARTEDGDRYALEQLGQFVNRAEHPDPLSVIAQLSDLDATFGWTAPAAALNGHSHAGPLPLAPAAEAEAPPPAAQKRKPRKAKVRLTHDDATWALVAELYRAGGPEAVREHFHLARSSATHLAAEARTHGHLGADEYWRDRQGPSLTPQAAADTVQPPVVAVSVQPITIERRDTHHHPTKGTGADRRSAPRPTRDFMRMVRDTIEALVAQHPEGMTAQDVAEVLKFHGSDDPVGYARSQLVILVKDRRVTVDYTVSPQRYYVR